MPDDERYLIVRDLLLDYVKSPSLRHIRDVYSINKLAHEIVRRMDRGNSIWKKWDATREVLLESTVACWVPIEDLRKFLNSMPGPQLTATDVEQRLKAFEEKLVAYPDEDLKEGCLALYEKEKAEGTEMFAIIGLLRDHLDSEEERLHTEQQEQYQRWREEDRTQLQKSRHWYCRANGRTYRLSPRDDKMWDLYRVNSIADDEEGALVGKYRARGDATKAVKEMAYKPEPRW